MTPYDTQSGVIIHAQAYETMAHGQFLVPVSNKSVIGICMLIAVLAGFIFVFTSGVQGYLFGGLLILAAHVTPHVAIHRRHRFSLHGAGSDGLVLRFRCCLIHALFRSPPVARCRKG